MMFYSILVHLANEDDRRVMEACGNLPRGRERLAQMHPDSRLEATLGVGYSKTREWLSRAGVPLPKSLLEFQEKQGPPGKIMPNTGTTK